MSTQRKLPNTDEKRNVALTVAKTKKDSTAPQNIVYMTGTITKLDTNQPLFANKMQLRGNALHTQSASTTNKTAHKARAIMFISHFIQGFNNGVTRGLFSASERAFYQLDVNSNSVPDLITDEQVITWGDRLINGDPERILAGGAAMGFPSIAEVQVEINDFKAAVIAQSISKDAYDLAQEGVSSMRRSIDKLILKIWDETETYFNGESPSNKRRKSREWGVVYISTTKNIISGVAIHSINGNPLQGVNAALLEVEAYATTNIDGKYILSTNHTGTGTLEFTLTGFKTKTYTVDIPETGSIELDASMEPI